MGKVGTYLLGVGKFCGVVKSGSKHKKKLKFILMCTPWNVPYRRQGTYNGVHGNRFPPLKA